MKICKYTKCCQDGKLQAKTNLAHNNDDCNNGIGASDHLANCFLYNVCEWCMGYY